MGYRMVYLGAPENNEPWMNLFRARGVEANHPASPYLMTLLDALVDGQSLADIIERYLKHPDTPRDWRYYMVKYEAMRSGSAGGSGCYVVASGAGYGMCMLKNESCDDRGNHADAYLLALLHQAQAGTGGGGNPQWPRSFPGYEINVRQLFLKSSRLGICCVPEGWQLDATAMDATQASKFRDVIAEFGLRPSRQEENIFLLEVQQQNHVDFEDRIVLGGALLKALLERGM